MNEYIKQINDPDRPVDVDEVVRSYRYELILPVGEEKFRTDPHINRLIDIATDNFRLLMESENNQRHHDLTPRRIEKLQVRNNLDRYQELIKETILWSPQENSD